MQRKKLTPILGLSFTIFLLLSQPIFASEFNQCLKIALEADVTDTYKFENSSEYRKTLNLAFTLNEETLKSVAQGGQAGLDIPIPMAKGLLQIGAQGSVQKDTMDSIRRKVGLSDTKTLDTSSYQWVTEHLQGKTKKELASLCPRGSNALTHSMVPEGYPNDQFLVTLSNFPQDDSDPDRKISWVAISPNIKFIGNEYFKKGAQIKKHNTLPQSFKRIAAGGPVYIKLGIEGLSQEIDLLIEEPAKASVNAGNPNYSVISFVTKRKSPHDIVTLELEGDKILEYNKNTKTGLDGNSWEVITGTRKKSQGKMEITWRSRDPRILDATTSHGPQNRCFQKVKKIYTLTATSVTEEKTIFKVPSNYECPKETKKYKVEFSRLR